MDNFDSYSRPPGPPPAPYEDTSVMTMKDWIITLIVCAIPCVGLVMLFVWGFGAGNVNRRNYCRAELILIAAVIVLYILFLVIFGAAMFAWFPKFSDYIH